MKPTLALFVCDPKCSVQSSNGVIKALSPHYNFKLFSKNEVEDGFLDGVDMVVFPGGFGNSDSYDTILKNNTKLITDFVKNGGRYLGICMGAYWAGSHYFNILDNVDAVQYIKQPNTDTKRPHAKAINVTWNGQKEKMFFYDGCALTGEGFKTIATYANGDPMAIIQKRIGLIGCHPESEKFWYDSYSWMKPYWHNNSHHKLLLEFVDELMQQ
jgi:hypothetical protein